MQLNPKTTQTFLLLIITLMLHACTIEKRLHNPGYHIAWKQRYASAKTSAMVPVNIPVIAENSRADVDTAMAALPVQSEDAIASLTPAQTIAIKPLILKQTQAHSVNKRSLVDNQTNNSGKESSKKRDPENGRAKGSYDSVIAFLIFGILFLIPAVLAFLVFTSSTGIFALFFLFATWILSGIAGVFLLSSLIAFLVTKSKNKSKGSPKVIQPEYEEDKPERYEEDKPERKKPGKSVFIFIGAIAVLAIGFILISR